MSNLVSKLPEVGVSKLSLVFEWEGTLWNVSCQEFPNCISQGATPEEAARMFYDALEGILVIYEQDGNWPYGTNPL